jgi:hypothetical protein
MRASEKGQRGSEKGCGLKREDGDLRKGTGATKGGNASERG